MKNNSTYIAVVLDRSGSMGIVRDDTIGGFNEFLSQQQNQLGEARLYLSQFDDVYEFLYDKPVKDAERLTHETFVPRGMTALYDAIGTTVHGLGKKLSDMQPDDRPAKVMVAIVTDGQENNSKKFSRKQIADMIEHQRSVYNWQFVYIGANQDAILSAAEISIPGAGALTYTANNTQHVFGQTLTRSVSALRAATTVADFAGAAAFTEEERADATKPS